MVQRVVYNACFGGFGFHEDAVKWVRQNEDKLKNEYDEEDVKEIADSTLSGETYPDGSGPKQDYIDYITDTHIDRDNELLADIVSHETEYTGQYNGDHSELRVAEVPDNIEWTLERHDGQETVKEATRTFS